MQKYLLLYNKTYSANVLNFEITVCLFRTLFTAVMVLLNTLYILLVCNITIKELIVFIQVFLHKRLAELCSY